MAGTRARRRSASPPAETLTGRGIAYAFRSQTVVAEIAEVEVNRATGHVWVKRMVVAHDCGLMINPEGLRRTLECGLLHSLSRALHEEVHVRHREGDQRGLATLPTLTHTDTPEKIDIVLVNGDPNPNRRTCRTTAPERPSASRRWPRWPTRSSTPRACASAGCRSRTHGFSPR